MSLRARVTKLEQAANPRGGVAILFKQVDETEDAARERWRQEHPGEDLEATDLQVTIVRWSDHPGDPTWPPSRSTIPRRAAP